MVVLLLVGVALCCCCCCWRSIGMSLLASRRMCSVRVCAWKNVNLFSWFSPVAPQRPWLPKFLLSCCVRRKLKPLPPLRRPPRIRARGLTPDLAPKRLLPKRLLNPKPRLILYRYINNFVKFFFHSLSRTSWLLVFRRLSPLMTRTL